MSRIYKELKDDIFLIRLRDIVWKEFSKQKYVLIIEQH